MYKPEQNGVPGQYAKPRKTVGDVLLQVPGRGTTHQSTYYHNTFTHSPRTASSGKLNALESSSSTRRKTANKLGASSRAEPKTPLFTPEDSGRLTSSLDSSSGRPHSANYTLSASSPVCVTARLFARTLMDNSPNNTVLDQMKQLGHRELSSRILKKGRQVGMRKITFSDFVTLVNLVIPRPSSDQEDYWFIFRFLDWSNTDILDLADLQDTLSTLFCPAEVIGALCCKHILYVKPLDKSLITLGEMDTMLSHLMTVCAPFLPSPDPYWAICNEIKQQLAELQLNYCVPSTTAKRIFLRFPSLVELLQCLRWDGTVALPQTVVSKLQTVIDRDSSSSRDFLMGSTTTYTRRRVTERHKQNTAILDCIAQLYNDGLSARGGELPACGGAVGSPTNYKFVADRYINRNKT